jgi:hypothetical protein
MMNHSDKESTLIAEDISNIPSTNDKNKKDTLGLGLDVGKSQYEHWDRTLSFPSYVIDSYKNKYPTTYAELRLDGLSKQHAARYIYRNCELYNGKIFDINDYYDGPGYSSGFGFIRYLSSN